MQDRAGRKDEVEANARSVVLSHVSSFPYSFGEPLITTRIHCKYEVTFKNSGGDLAVAGSCILALLFPRRRVSGGVAETLTGICRHGSARGGCRLLELGSIEDQNAIEDARRHV